MADIIIKTYQQINNNTPVNNNFSLVFPLHFLLFLLQITLKLYHLNIIPFFLSLYHVIYILYVNLLNYLTSYYFSVITLYVEYFI